MAIGSGNSIQASDEVKSSAGLNDFNNQRISGIQGGGAFQQFPGFPFPIKGTGDGQTTEHCQSLAGVPSSWVVGGLVGLALLWLLKQKQKGG